MFSMLSNISGIIILFHINILDICMYTLAFYAKKCFLIQNVLYCLQHIYLEGQVFENFHKLNYT